MEDEYLELVDDALFVIVFTNVIITVPDSQLFIVITVSDGQLFNKNDPNVRCFKWVNIKSENGQTVDRS